MWSMERNFVTHYQTLCQNSKHQIHTRLGVVSLGILERQRRGNPDQTQLGCGGQQNTISWWFHWPIFLFSNTPHPAVWSIILGLWLETKPHNLQLPSLWTSVPTTPSPNPIARLILSPHNFLIEWQNFPIYSTYMALQGWMYIHYFRLIGSEILTVKFSRIITVSQTNNYRTSRVWIFLWKYLSPSCKI